MNFEKITIDKKQLFEKHQRGTGLMGTVSGFAANFLWADYVKQGYLIVGDTLFVGYEKEDKVCVTQPYSTGDAQTDCRELAKAAVAGGKKLEFRCIEPPVKDLLLRAFPTASVKEDRDYSDYLYLRENLAQLKGKKYHAKKNHLNKFLRSYRYEYQPLDAGCKKECLGVAKQWFDTRETSSSEQYELKAIELLFDNFEALGAMGGLIAVSGEPAAFTAAVRLRPDSDVADVCFEKSLQGYDGIYAAINNLFAASLGEDTVWLNREEDMGIEGLRKAKLSYRPDLMLQKYTVTVEE